MTPGTVPTLTANAVAYSEPIDEQSEVSELAWAGEKLRVIGTLLARGGPFRRLLDVGCRGGLQAASYARHALIEEIHGTEIAESALGPFRQRGFSGHVWLGGEAPFPADADTFDCIVAGDVIEHVFNTDFFVSELHRVLTPGGILLISTPNLAWWWNRGRVAIGKVPAGVCSVSSEVSFGGTDAKHLRVSTVDEWLHLFHHLGLHSRGVYGFTYPMLRLGMRELDFTVSRRFPTFAHSVLFDLSKPGA
jgi:2-polyprenyl-3-methyl-5-hydroxy-6-metoxy-1,4-benzoquinol methylase